MAIYRLCNAVRLLENEQIKLRRQIEYYQEQNKAEKGRNSLIDFDKAIDELNFTLLELEDEVKIINKLIGGEK